MNFVLLFICIIDFVLVQKLLQLMSIAFYNTLFYFRNSTLMILGTRILRSITCPQFYFYTGVGVCSIRVQKS